MKMRKNLEIAMAVVLLLGVVTLPVSIGDGSAMRNLPAECVGTDDVFTVGITSPGTGAVVETLCDGWFYVFSSLPADQVSVDGNTITFMLLGNPEFTYEVQASDTEGASCTIAGVFTDIDQVDHAIGGDLEVTVCSAIASRDLPDECVVPDAEVQVTITSPGMGAVTETICDGWTYVGSSIPLFDQTGNDLTFVLAGDTTFIYTIKAPNIEGACCDITGIFKDMGEVEHIIGGESKVCVCICGDVNSDGIVDMDDVILLLEHVGNQRGYAWAGDVNCDGEVNVGDVILLLNHVGDSYELGCCE
ncbi:MAG: hypothetical protein SYNGOMJ08_00809 [Candidatus Syntrophoarchaeum sp. GoM_oil]|nr:MAG: hypothetical protein SYNGOMJ08_00809 [Candidatus Syntrophoarchaeum sp. GoM_oil]